MPDFRIQIERLTDEQERFEFEASPEWWSAREPESEETPVSAEIPFRFELKASRTGEEVLIEGDLEGRVLLECGRCAKRYPHVLREPYRLVLEPHRLGDDQQGSRSTFDGAGGLDPEGERGLAENGVSLGEDLEAGLYRGAVVGLDDFFGEVIALAMPIQPLCDERCLGVCSHCGQPRTNDSKAGCDCEDEKIESPFAVLAQLKQQMED